MNELERLVNASVSGDFCIAINDGILSGEDAEIARMINKFIHNYHVAVEYDLMKYKLTRDALGIGLWDMNVYNDDPVNPGNDFFWSQELREMLGFSSEQELPNVLSCWIDRIHPEDRERVVGLFSDHLNDRTGKIKLDGEYRLMLKNGKYRHFHAFGTTLRDKDGTPLRVAGALEDIEEKKQMQEAIKQRERMLNALNEMSVTLLAHEDKAFQNIISDGIKPVARVAGLDRLAVYRNLDGKNQFGQIYLWYGKSIPLEEELVMLPDIPPVKHWVEQLYQNKCINANVEELKEDEKAFLSLFGVKAIFFVPVFVHDDLWGIITLEDHTNYRCFEEDNLDLLRSAAHLCASAVIRDEMQKQVDDANRLNSAMLASAPIGMVLYDDNLKIINCNDAICKMFEADKDHCINNFFETMPEYQPNGEKSLPFAKKLMRQALDGHDMTIEWMHNKKNGKAIPCEVTLTRILIGEKYIGLAHTYDISNIKKLTEYLKEALEQATAASRAKGDFLSCMSHEMRTPLNAIIGMTTIGRNAKDIEKKNHAFNEISNASTHLLGVINDVLDMAKIEANKLELSLVEFDFYKLVQNVVTVINFRMEEKKQKFTVNIDSRIPRFFTGDDQRLSQVITNLLSNAIKFTPEGGDIHLEASFLGEENGLCELQIEVADSGIGISREQQARLFRAFEQADSGTSREYGGTGLGLVITKRIVEMMGGSIRVESDINQGARFIFTIKARTGSSAGGEYDESANSAKDAKILTGEFAGKKMLLVEDIDINREILIALLADTGIAIECAENGMQALEMIKASPGKYDVVFMDIQMPQMDGLETTRRIREFEEKQLQRRYCVPIVAMTANVFRSDIEECQKAGMNSHLGKPLDIEKVLETLRKYLINF